jgi:hypothetical protein
MAGYGFPYRRFVRAVAYACARLDRSFRFRRVVVRPFRLHHFRSGSSLQTSFNYASRSRFPRRFGY